MNPDIAAEREKRTFNPDHVTERLFGKRGMFHRRLAYKRAADDPDFKVAERFVMMPRDEVYNEAVRIYTSLIQKAQGYGYLDDARKGDDDALHFYVEGAFIDTVYPFGLHNSMFIPAIESQATEEQKKVWLPLAKKHQIIGTYAQTEMGHGTFLRGLETTATYDKEREEFIIHSPTITSTKYWPGGLGKTSNYAVVMAQLIIDGKGYGMHAFMVQLRNLNTHEPLPGIELGDINTKFGYENIDNGFLRMNKRRIPRTNMLMGYNQVAPDGTYTRKAIPQITYLTMVLIRMMIVLGSCNDLAMAATIATRYSAVRRQTANSKGVEPQILDYQTQQMKLFPSIATAYALFFTGDRLRDIYHDITTSIKSGDTGRLPEIHCLTSCLKAYASEIASLQIEVCRQACGGHGYSHASGIPKIYVRCVPGCTYEGENTVMYLQCARSLIKFLGMVQAEKPLPPIMQFLKEPVHVPDQLKSATIFDFELYQLAFKLNTLFRITHTAGKMQDAIYSDNVDAERAWNDNSFDLVQSARANAMYLSVCLFIEELNKSGWEANALAVMKQVCEFYIVNTIINNSGSFLQNQILSSSQMEVMSARSLELLKILRPNAVTLVDAFDHPDRLLNSCLGRYDGNVYEALYEYAKNSSLNKQQVHPSFHKYVKPMRNAMQSNL